MANRILNSRGQGILEVSVALVIIVLFLGGALNIWIWGNNQIVKRQMAYNETRVSAGSSSDAYTKVWPAYTPDDLVEEKVVLDTKNSGGRE